MNIRQRFLKNASELLGNMSSNIEKEQGSFGPSTGQESAEVAMFDVNQDEGLGRQAIYPQWFFSSHFGQPRNIKLHTLRDLAKSDFAQMVITTQKREVSTTDYKFINDDEEDEQDYEDEKKLFAEFLENMNSNRQDWNDIVKELIDDYGVIDAMVTNLVYTRESYDIAPVPAYDNYGREVGTEEGVVLKPFGQRELASVKSVDGGTMLKQTDIHKNLLNFWQYSFKNPRQNPTRFEADEINYDIMNPKPSSIYGFSPVEACQQALECIMNGTKWNKDFYHNNAIPNLLVSLPKLKKTELRKLKRSYYSKYRGKAHQIGFINWDIANVHKLTNNAKDMEWLNGMDWYRKVIFASWGLSDTEAGFYMNSNRSNDEGQERVTVRNGLKPLYDKFEKLARRIQNEFFQKEMPFRLKYIPSDQVQEKVEFEQNMQMLDRGALTVNEFRKIQGKSKVEWGDEPLRKPFDESNFMGMESPRGRPDGQENNMKNPKGDPDDDSTSKSLQPDRSGFFTKKYFEDYIDDRTTDK